MLSYVVLVLGCEQTGNGNDNDNATMYARAHQETNIEMKTTKKKNMGKSC